MNLQFKKYCFFFILTIPVFIFSQSKEANLFEKKVLKEKSLEYSKEQNFVKSQSFYLNENWDSTLVYSMKQLSANNNKKIADYCHYFRGVSFFNKKLYSEAKKELFLVSNSFELLASKNLILGAVFFELLKPNEALYFFKLSKIQFEKTKDFNGLAKAFNGIGSMYIYLKQYENAEKYLLKHLETSKVLNESLKSISEDIFEKYQKENPCTVDIESHERLKKMFQNDLSRMIAPLSGKYGFGDISSKKSV